MTHNESESLAVYDAVGISIAHDAQFRSEMERRLVRRWGDGVAKWKDGTCKICASVLPVARDVVNIFGEEVVFTFGCCDDCATVRDAHYSRRNAEALIHSRTPWWDENCPALYVDLIDGTLPERINRNRFERIVSYVPPANGRGLIVTGQSGAGKTTAMWALARELERREYGCTFLTAVELQRQLSEAARDIKSIKHLTHCRVLMIDDLGKEKLTASVAALLWELIDSRYANRRPMIITTRYGGKDFEGRFGDNVLGIDIRRRLTESCEAVML